MVGEHTKEAARGWGVDHEPEKGHDASAPGARALSAMAAAAQRARQPDRPVGPSWDDSAQTAQVHPVVGSAVPPRLAVFHGQGQLLRRAIFVVAGVIVVLLAVLLGVHLSGTSGTPSTSARQGSQSGGATTHPSSSNASTPANVAPSTTSPVSTPGGPPQLSSLNPPQGSAGQQVAISGSNFMSANGQIVAYFGSQVAPTSCPVQSSCTVTVPPMQGTTTTVPVTVQTQAGTSNALAFTYQ
jgi:hypothetical protein